MEDREFGVLADANTARRASYLLRSLHRAQAGMALDQDDQQRVEWLIKQLIASRRGALMASVRGGADAIGPDNEPVTTSFSSEQQMYQLFRRYSSAPTPEKHAVWVDQLVETLRHVSDSSATPVEAADESTVREKVEPLLRRLSELSGRSPSRESPLFST